MTDGEKAAEPCSFADNGGRCQRHAKNGCAAGMRPPRGA
ncbi:hypothetical protein XCR_1172 [Xanthomonas campestris pv. raphani 756C]|nr:hypothetical protein XCR_1172 [Xanthomonas campestris pv. raphani 756C]